VTVGGVGRSCGDTGLGEAVASREAVALAGGTGTIATSFPENPHEPVVGRITSAAELGDLVQEQHADARGFGNVAGAAKRGGSGYSVAGPQSMNRGRNADIGKIVLICEPSGCIRNRPDRLPISSRNTIHRPFGEYPPTYARWFGLR
jgi:hypothetical protein